ncbi:bumetanide-sensitive Na-K-Cl cotransport protein [Culex quinquefasciatus]|uniref:Bumetanide-sensitive Na-K-Cl cotransport protein n=1 Tax=Culex quinquefasciatus TaxID=7176 RepID=B0XAM6_CULQU|nr:bumetanide-sensitive Na-K-Cl cotransport protein [Culex quinquefasciatus]|eukprot:XP_001866698.1 bumetanide-sensitive Na-K-Cl cotransport protein [Culex quinquefasciatus]
MTFMVEATVEREATGNVTNMANGSSTFFQCAPEKFEYGLHNSFQIINLDELTYYQVTLHRRWMDRARPCERPTCPSGRRDQHLTADSVLFNLIESPCTTTLNLEKELLICLTSISSDLLIGQIFEKSVAGAHGLDQQNYPDFNSSVTEDDRFD